MIIINKPEELLDIQCYRCKTIMKAHSFSNMNSDYYMLCELHKNTECEHGSDGFYYLRTEEIIFRSEYLSGPINFDNAEYKCKKCGEFYR